MVDLANETKEESMILSSTLPEWRDHKQGLEITDRFHVRQLRYFYRILRKAGLHKAQARHVLWQATFYAYLNPVAYIDLQGDRYAR